MLAFWLALELCYHLSNIYHAKFWRLIVAAKYREHKNPMKIKTNFFNLLSFNSKYGEQNELNLGRADFGNGSSNLTGPPAEIGEAGNSRFDICRIIRVA